MTKSRFFLSHHSSSLFAIFTFFAASVILALGSVETNCDK